MLAIELLPPPEQGTGSETPLVLLEISIPDRSTRTTGGEHPKVVLFPPTAVSAFGGTSASSHLFQLSAKSGGTWVILVLLGLVRSTEEVDRISDDGGTESVVFV